MDKILVEMIGVQVKMRRDRRCKPRCPGCEMILNEVREGEICAFDLPMADKTAVWVTLPVVQGRCPKCAELSTPRLPAVHPTRNATDYGVSPEPQALRVSAVQNDAGVETR